jgi:VanZ family protein
MKVTFRLLLMLVWAMILGVLTCSLNLEALFHSHAIEFAVNLRPDYSDFFAFDLTKIHPKWLLVKLGHFIGFGIMDVLFLNVFRKHKPALISAILFAIFTEICQLYFNRDGRLYDVVIDSLGAMLSYSAAQIVLHWKSKSSRKQTAPIIADDLPRS